MLDRPGPRLSGRAQKLAAIGQSSAWETADLALRRAAAGDDVLLLSLGDPVCPPHPAIVAAATSALQNGRTHYTPLLGEHALREAIARVEGCATDNVVVLPGAQHAALAVFTLIAGEGDEVILSDPYYATYPGVVAAAGAQPIKVPARADLSIDIEAIAAAISPNTRAIFLNSPANPSGTALSPADYARLRDLAEAHDVWIVVDEVYASFRYDGQDIRAWKHGPAGRTIVLNSLSKSHAMTGFRCGWALVPPTLVPALGDWSAAALFGVSQFVQDAAVVALSLPAAELADYHNGFKARAHHVVQRVNAIQGLRAALPAGGMFVMADCTGVNPDDIALARTLLETTGVALVPGSGFGAGGHGHLRISLTPDIETLDRAFDRISGFVAR
ncbi:pyridoxal phosphate-dependent aminotransferase [Sandaracinobacteroides hominis]|uniref:pyridoxal phosphate-dependent aminotransferase n=1 Tax=Sandaracinobacteroides hominis TaxID=2780086 RepID=UPI0018F4BAC6|nr:pyridoxal phosphate-dependent aminotransferase [Sandaracinobacteroides hominis]